MSMTVSGISTAVQGLLDDMDSFATVLAAPPSKGSDFAGFPSACHYYVGAESNYATVSQNRRVIEYVVEIYVRVREETPTATELSKAYALADDTMDVFDHAINLGGACDIMRPTPSGLERIETKDGPGLLMTIRLFCEADITFRDM